MPLSLVTRRDRRPVLILDLDGTILRANSFPRWAMHLARGRFAHMGAARRLGISAAAFKALMQRKLRLMDHGALKWRLQRLWQAATADDGGVAERELVESLATLVRPEFAPLFTGIGAGGIDAILATAAVEDYALGLGRSLGFSHILATAATRGEHEPDNSGERKRNAVLKFLATQGWLGRPRILFTDHIDDLPLIRVCETIYWFGTPAMRARIERDVPGLDMRNGERQPYEHTEFAEAV